MDLDELLYERIWRYLRGKRKQAIEADNRRITLDSLQSRLTLMARAFTGRPVEIFPAEREGGYKNLSFFLPTACNHFGSADANTAFYFFRVAYLSVQAQAGLNGGPHHPILSEAHGRQLALEFAPKVLNILEEIYPIVIEIHNLLKEKIDIQQPDSTQNKLIDASWLYGKWMQDDPDAPTFAPLEHSGEAQAAQPEKPQNSRTAKAVEEIRRVMVDQKQQEDFVLTHNFEKVETAEEFDGVWRDFDGSDELEKHQEAVDELNLRLTVRTHDTAHAVLQAEFMEHVAVAESADSAQKGHFIAYPEWDYRLRAYRPDFCRVYPGSELALHPDFCRQTLANHRSELLAMRKMLSLLHNQYEQQRRQSDGPDFDLDAVTEGFTDIHAGRTPSERLYLSQRRTRRDLAITLLLDTSLSSDGYVAGVRIIDIEKKVALLFGEILHEFDIQFSVATFHSQTRNYLSYNTIKDFDTPWQRARNAIGGIEPCGYTRMGGALRHAGSQLAKQEARSRWVLFISDGKPNDFDRYEGRHGVQDVKQAIRELSTNHIQCYALAIEDKAKYYLPQMFGTGHYQIVPNMQELLKTMVFLFEKMRQYM